MALERALKAIRLEPTDRIPRLEMVSHPDFIQKVTGIDSGQHPQIAQIKLIETLDLDIDRVPPIDEPITVSFTDDNESIIDQDGNRVVRWGAGTTWRWNWGEHFHNIDQILDYEPRTIHYPESVETLTQQFQASIDLQRELLGNRCLPFGDLYTTLLMWPLMTFGWELTLEATSVEPERFKTLLDRFTEVSLKVIQAWANTDIDLFISHDDICMTSGPIFNPKWYREIIYPRYERLWAPLKQKGKKVVFLSDGNLDLVAADIFAAGADGLFFEPLTDLTQLVKEYGNTKILIGNIDSRVLLLDEKEAIYKEVERCTKLGKDCPGYFYCVSNHITYNIPVANVEAYFAACDQLGKRN